MTRYYHGSPVSGLTTLIPQATYYQKQPHVYLSTNEVVAVFYILKRDYMWYTYGFTEQGIPEYTESYKGNLKEFYGNLKGYIYVSEGDFPVSNSMDIKVAVVCDEPVKITQSIYIENCLERLYEYEAKGKLIIHRYENLTEKQKTSNRQMVRGAIKRLDLLAGKHPLSPFVKEKFPDLWEEEVKKAPPTS
ncbi:MAG: hypothetical protein PHE50_05455 [Dehalococcoidales bacterium]|nr:hypothetical protein [Dehalococcoidales bacterium]